MGLMELGGAFRVRHSFNIPFLKTSKARCFWIVGMVIGTTGIAYLKCRRFRKVLRGLRKLHRKLRMAAARVISPSRINVIASDSDRR